MLAVAQRLLCLRTFTMTLKIVRDSDGRLTVIRLIGRMQSEHLEEVEGQVAASGPHVVLDLDEVTVVDADVVRYFNACEARRMTLRHCPPYVREWMTRERADAH